MQSFQNQKSRVNKLYILKTKPHNVEASKYKTKPHTEIKETICSAFESEEADNKLHSDDNQTPLRYRCLSWPQEPQT